MAKAPAEGLRKVAGSQPDPRRDLGGHHARGEHRTGMFQSKADDIGGDCHARQRPKIDRQVATVGPDP